MRRNAIVKWDPEECTLQEAQLQQNQGFEITSIINLNEMITTPTLREATTLKWPRGRAREAVRNPSSTKCLVQFALPSPQGLTHIRTIKGGAIALDAFPASITLPTPTTLPAQTRTSTSLEAQAPPHTTGEDLAPSSPLPQPTTRRRQPPISPAWLPRRVQNDLLKT